MYVELLYAAVNVSVALPTEEVVMDAGEKLAETPACRPLAESATVPSNPFHADTFTVKLIECPSDKAV